MGLEQRAAIIAICRCGCYRWVAHTPRGQPPLIVQVLMVGREESNAHENPVKGERHPFTGEEV